MKNKAINKPLKWFLAFFLCVMCVASMQVYGAEEKPDEQKTEELQQENRNDPCSIYGKDTDDYYACIADRKASVATSDFIAGALYSQNEEIRGREIESAPDYIKNFSNSNQVAIAYGMSIWDWDTILMHLIGLIIKFFEMIGGVITLIVMVLFNFSSTSFWQEAVNSVFAVIDGLVFDWQNPDSIFMKFVVFAILFTIIQKLVKNFKQIFGLREVIQIIVSTVLAAILVVGVARYGKPVMDKVETMAMSFVSDTIGEIQEGISEDGDTYEIATKKTIFEVMQLQGFRLRHFGVTSVDQIKGENKEERFTTLLNDPSQENAKNEREDYDSNNIIYNSGVALNVLMMSLIFLVHRILLAIVIGSGSFLVIAVSMIKELLMCVSIYALIKCIVTPERKQAMSWFFNRVTWMFLAEGSKLVLSILLFGIMKAIELIIASNAGVLALLPFDAVLVAGMFYVVKNGPRLLQKLVSSLGSDGQGTIRNADNLMHGRGPLRTVGNFVFGRQGVGDIMDNFHKSNRGYDDTDLEENSDFSENDEIQSKISSVKDLDMEEHAHDLNDEESSQKKNNAIPEEEISHQGLDIDKELSKLDKEKTDYEESDELKENEKSKVGNLGDDSQEASKKEEDTDSTEDPSKISTIDDSLEDEDKNELEDEKKTSHQELDIDKELSKLDEEKADHVESDAIENTSQEENGKNDPSKISVIDDADLENDREEMDLDSSHEETETDQSKQQNIDSKEASTNDQQNIVENDDSHEHKKMSATGENNLDDIEETAVDQQEKSNEGIHTKEVMSEPSTDDHKLNKDDHKELDQFLEELNEGEDDEMA